MKNINPEEVVHNWPTQFAEVFDRIFGDKHLTWKCFIRSSVASLLSGIVVYFIYISAQYENIIEQKLVSFFEVGKIFEGIIIFAIANLIADYLSLLETRYVLKWMIRSHNKFARLTILLILDLVLTFLLWSIAYLFAISLVYGGNVQYYLERFINHLWITVVPLGHHSPFRPPGVSFYTTFFTSLWIWLYLFSGLVVKTIIPLNMVVRWSKNHLNINDKPLRSMALVSIMIVTIIFIVVPFLR